MNEKKNGFETASEATSSAKNRKRLIAIIISIVLAIGIIVFCVWFFFLRGANSNADPVYVSSVASIAGLETQSVQKYSGIVNPEKNLEVKKDESKTISEIYVVEGQEITAGERLFSYDINEMQLSLQQSNLDLESCRSNISTLKNQITDLEKEKKSASSDEKLTYTIKIQEAELEIKKEEYNASTKQAEIAEIEKSIANADVYAEKDGIIKSVNTNSETDSNGNVLPFISIQTTSEYKIKGTVSELNISSIYEGQAVKVYSRIDSNLSWDGFIESIDYENPVEDSNNYYYSDSGSGEKASKYNFYVVVDNLEGIILGQHVYIAPDYGQDETREGIWIPSYYILDIENSPFVWAKSSKDTLEKRSLTLGEHDEENDLYEITDGLSAEDYIAYPTEDMKSGTPALVDDAMGYMPADSPVDGEAAGDEYLEGGEEANEYIEGEAGTDEFVEDEGTPYGDDGVDGTVEGNAVPEEAVASTISYGAAEVSAYDA